MEASVLDGEYFEKCQKLASVLDVASKVVAPIEERFTAALGSDDVSASDKEKCRTCLKKLPEAFPVDGINFDFGSMLSDVMSGEDVDFLVRMLGTKRGQTAWASIVPVLEYFFTEYIPRRYQSLDS